MSSHVTPYHSDPAARLKQRLFQLLLFLSAGCMLAGGAGAGQPAAALADRSPSSHLVPAPASYRAINLSLSGPLNGLTNFNSKDQFAIAILDANDYSRAYFYDGRSLQEIGSLGGIHTIVTGINDEGEVAGYSSTAGSGRLHAFRWSKREGMRDLGALFPDGVSYTGQSQPINDRGHVVGYATTPGGQTHAYLWTPAEGMRDLGGLPGNETGFSVAHLINNDDLVAGHGEGVTIANHAFAWTRRHGMVEIPTPGFSVAVAMTQSGLIAGSARHPTGNHVYAWTRSRGVRDLGAAGFEESFFYGNPISSNGHMVVGLRSDGGNIERAGFWLGTPNSNLFALGTFGGPISFATGVNNKAHVIGQADVSVSQRIPYIWTFRDGMLRLAPRVQAPPGLIVDYPLRIADSGLILALATNANFILLKPDCRCGGQHSHTVGAIDSVDLVEVGVSFNASVGFTTDDAVASHYVAWTWGDGTGEQQGNAVENKGAGRASATHLYAAPGVYTVSAKVGDRGGQGPTVTHTIVAYTRDAGAASGWFTSPVGANKAGASQGSRATFQFVAPAASGARAQTAQAMLRFHDGMLNFRSAAIQRLPVQSDGQEAGQEGGARFEGTGTINGAGAYHFALALAAGRFGLTIWHVDPTTRARVVDYDNLGAGLGSVVPAAQGTVAVQ